VALRISLPSSQRLWSTRSQGRTPPCLLGLYSLVALVAKTLHPAQVPACQAACYAKEGATFADAVAMVRGNLRAAAR
jgi:hypothetical protein